jgi:hypothetical protein
MGLLVSMFPPSPPNISILYYINIFLKLDNKPFAIDKTKIVERLTPRLITTEDIV